MRDWAAPAAPAPGLPSQMAECWEWPPRLSAHAQARKGGGLAGAVTCSAFPSHVCGLETGLCPPR